MASPRSGTFCTSISRPDAGRDAPRVSPRCDQPLIASTARRTSPRSQVSDAREQRCTMPSHASRSSVRRRTGSPLGSRHVRYALRYRVRPHHHARAEAGHDHRIHGREVRAEVPHAAWPDVDEHEPTSVPAHGAGRRDSPRACHFKRQIGMSASTACHGAPAPFSSDGSRQCKGYPSLCTPTHYLGGSVARLPQPRSDRAPGQFVPGGTTSPAKALSAAGA
jgi:hypothetical protein